MLSDTYLELYDTHSARSVRLTARKLALEEIRIVARSGVEVECVADAGDRKSTRLNSSPGYISYAVFCLKNKKQQQQ